MGYEERVMGYEERVMGLYGLALWNTMFVTS